MVTKQKRHILMLGTSINTLGGISSVVKVYLTEGLLDRFPVIYLATHCDGGKWAKLDFLCSSWLQFMLLLVRGKIGLLHVHTASDASFWRKTLFFIPAFCARVPCILHLHGGGFREFYQDRNGAIGKWLIRKVLDRVERIIVLSNTWQDWIRTITKNPRIVPIYNPVLLPGSVDFAVRQSSTILFLGRLTERKGVFDLLQASAAIIAEYPDLRLLLGGDGDLAAAKEQAEQLGLAEHVDILGWVAGADKSALLARAAVYVLPSYAEGMPMSVLEAMAFGLPIIATPVGGMPEVVTDGLEGWLVAPGDIAGLANALRKMLSNPLLRQRMGRAARDKAESTFSTTRTLPQIERFYIELGVNPVA